MPLADKYADLSYYFKYLSRKSNAFDCPRCGISILPKDFENHSVKMHHFNTKCSCVWCWGETSWMSGRKSKNTVHLMDCFKTFISSNPPITTTTSHDYTDIEPVPLNLDEDLCVGESFFDHASHYIRDSLPAEALKSFSILAAEPLPLEHGHENLDLAASFVQMYLDTHDTHDWLHVMVKGVAFEKFLRAMEEDDGVTGLLPFSCWCDAGSYRQIGHRQHRHFLAVAPKRHFQNGVWPKVAPNEKLCRYFRGKKSLSIESPLHLVNLLGYLSGRQSRCRDEKNLTTDNHFYIFKTLPVQYKLPLVTLWEDGVAELLKQEKFTNVSVSRLADTPLFREGLEWRQKIRDFYDFERGLVLPVAKRFLPTADITPYYRYLTRRRRLYFRPSAENESLDRDVWLRKQVRGGNCFYDNVGEETWTPRLNDQKKLNDLMPRVHRIREQDTDIASLKEENERWKQECNAKQAKIDELKDKIIHNSEGEIKSLKEIIKNSDRVIKSLKNENLFLRSIVETYPR